MSGLHATFSLTPRTPFYSTAIDNFVTLDCSGAYFWFDGDEGFSSQYATNRFFFNSPLAADPNLDYTQWPIRKRAPFLGSFIALSSYAGAQKQLALIFGFDVQQDWLPGRVLIYTDAGLLKDQQLVYGDNQFLLEIESLDEAFSLYFIHAGGNWFFRELSGYVV